MNQFLHQIYKKVNVPPVKNLPIFIVLTVVIIISGYVLTIGKTIKQIIINIRLNEKFQVINELYFLSKKC